jgi:hypothetical protein
MEEACITSERSGYRLTSRKDRPKRESRYVKVARLAYTLAKQELPCYSHPKSPHTYTQPPLAACGLLGFSLNLCYRDLQEWLLASAQVCQVLGLENVPDYSPLSRAFKRLTIRDGERLSETLLDAVAAADELIALDSTGYRLSRASAYYQTRSGRKWRHWQQGAYAVGCDTQFILAARQGIGPGSDTRFLPGLRRDAARYGRHEGRWRAWIMLADAGFEGQKGQEGDLIPPIRRHGQRKDPERIARLELVSQARLDGAYGQRWKSETVPAVLKRKFGDCLRSRKPSLQRREPVVKGLVYNMHR